MEEVSELYLLREQDVITLPIREMPMPLDAETNEVINNTGQDTII